MKYPTNRNQLVRQLVLLLLGLATLMILAVGTRTQFAQNKRAHSFVPASQQDLVDVQGPDIVGLRIDLRSPRFLENTENVNFNRHNGAAPFVCAKASLGSEVLEA